MKSTENTNAGSGGDSSGDDDSDDDDERISEQKHDEVRPYDKSYGNMPNLEFQMHCRDKKNILIYMT